MKNTLLYTFIFIYQASLFAAFGINIGSYSTRPSIPAQIQQLKLPTQIIQNNGSFQLFVGPFNSRAQALQTQQNFNIQGSILEYSAPNQTQSIGGRESFAVEILSSRDINSVPRRIIDQVITGGMQPVFVMDKGLYRLVVGPFRSAQEAQGLKARLSDMFGRNMFIINLPLSRFSSAIRPNAQPTGNIPQNRVQISSNDNNEHLGFLEQQRQGALNKYSTQPYGPTTPEVIRTAPVFRPAISPLAKLSEPMPQVSSGGVLLSVGAISSKHTFVVNGKQITGTFSPGLELGYKANDNTLFQLSYFKPETKMTTVFIQNTQTVNIKSTYSFMTSAQLKYRYFLPTLNSVFLSTNIGLDFVKQQVISTVPINFGTSYTYDKWYVQTQLGIGAGYRLGRMLTLGIDYNSYITLKTISSNMKLYLNLEF